MRNVKTHAELVHKINGVDSEQVCLIIDLSIDEKTCKSIADLFEVSFKQVIIRIRSENIHKTLPRFIQLKRDRLLCLTIDNRTFPIIGENMIGMLDTLSKYTKRDVMTLREVEYMIAGDFN